MQTQTFNDPLSGTTRVSRYQKGKTNQDFTEARGSKRKYKQKYTDIPGPTCVNFVHAMNSANHYATPPTVSGSGIS